MAKRSAGTVKRKRKEGRGKREEKAEREPSENDAFLGDVRGTRA